MVKEIVFRVHGDEVRYWLPGWYQDEFKITTVEKFDAFRAIFTTLFPDVVFRKADDNSDEVT